MFIIRKIGKTLRGQAKPYQIITAAVLGSLVGFAPPIGQAPLYILGIVLLLAIINANFFIATATAAIAKLLALALTPVSFELGLVLVDGPLQPLFKLLANAPVTAWMGFEYYITAGGTVLAIVIGTALGVGYLNAIASFRKKMATLEEGSEKYAAFVAKPFVRVLMWVLFGGKAKQTYAELAEQKKIGNPLRPLGIVFALLVVALLFIVQQFASGPIITTLLKGQLEQFHGATVDLEGIELDLAAGSLTVDRLAMADPDDLATDLIRANQVSAKLSATDLLSKRFAIAHVLVDDAVQGAKRDTPGVLIRQRPTPSPAPEEGKSIEDYFSKAKDWKERLETYYDWYRRIKGPPKQEDAKQDPSVKDRLREWAKQYGYANVKAAHLIEGSPSVLVKRVEINKLRATWPEEETLDIVATNLSTHPALVSESPRVTVKSSGQTFDLDTTIAPSARTEEDSKLAMTLRNQSIDETLADLDLGSQSTISGGTWQAGIDGSWSDLDGLALPLTIMLEDTAIALPGVEPTPIERLPVNLGIAGAIDNPAFSLDYKQLMADLKPVVGNAVMKQYLGLASNEVTDVLNEALGEEGGNAILQGLGGLIGGNRDDSENEADEDNADDSSGGLGDQLREGIGGFLNRGREEDE